MRFLKRALFGLIDFVLFARSLLAVLALLVFVPLADAACFFQVTKNDKSGREVKISKFYSHDKGAQYSCREIKSKEFSCDHTNRPMGPESMPSGTVRELAKSEFSLSAERCVERRAVPSADLQCSVQSNRFIANNADFKRQASTDSYGTTLNKHVLLIERATTQNGFLLSSFKTSEKLAPDVSTSFKRIGFDIIPGGSHKAIVRYSDVEFTVSCQRRDSISSMDPMRTVQRSVER